MPPTVSLHQLVRTMNRQSANAIPELVELEGILDGDLLIETMDLAPALKMVLLMCDHDADFSAEPLADNADDLATQVFAAGRLVADSIDPELDHIGAFYLIVHLVEGLMTGQIHGPGPFDRFALNVRAERLNKDFSSLNERLVDRLPELVAKGRALQAEAERMTGRGIFIFLPQTVAQVEAMKSTLGDPRLRNEGVRPRIDRMFRGLKREDGQCFRSDACVIGLLTVIKQRMERRRANFDQLKRAFIRLAGLDPKTPVQFRLHGASIHMSDMESMTLHRYRRRGQRRPLPDDEMIVVRD